MALGFGKLVQFAKGGLDMDGMLETLSALGVEMEVNPLPCLYSSETEALASAASRDGAKIVRLTATLKGGETMSALVVMTPARKDFLLRA